MFDQSNLSHEDDDSLRWVQSEERSVLLGIRLTSFFSNSIVAFHLPHIPLSFLFFSFLFFSFRLCHLPRPPMFSMLLLVTFLATLCVARNSQHAFSPGFPYVSQPVQGVSVEVWLVLENQTVFRIGASVITC